MRTNFYQLTKSIIKENKKQALLLVQQGKISQENFEAILKIDPTPSKKFTGWMAKQWYLGKINNIDHLRNTIEEFNSFLNRGKTKKNDIYQYNDFQELKKEVDNLNNIDGGMSLKELEEDYEIIKDDNNLLIVVPHTHEASRKMGISKFSYRKCDDGTTDSAWCTTFKAPNHFNDYYYNQDHTFYYVRVKSNILKQNLIEQGFDESYFVSALVVGPDETIGYNGLDKQFNGTKLKRYLSILRLQ
jgi:hypothetical protein